MIKLVNKLTGGDTWVHESRLDEYLEAGYKLASSPSKSPKDEGEKKPARARKK